MFALMTWSLRDRSDRASTFSSRFPRATSCSLTLLVVLLLAAPVWADELTLRINDVKGEAGGLIAVEVRTYAPRGVGQGQICLFAASRLSNSGSGSFAGPSVEPLADAPDGGLRARDARPEARDLAATTAPRSAVGASDSRSRELPDQPLLTLEGVVVLSGLGDAIYSSFFDAGTQLAMVDFASDSATINEADGPMLVLYFRLSEDLLPDQEFKIGLDREYTFIVDAKGEAVELELKPGRLRIEEPGDGDPCCGEY